MLYCIYVRLKPWIFFAYLVLLIIMAFSFGALLRSADSLETLASIGQRFDYTVYPTYSHGPYPQSFFDKAYNEAGEQDATNAKTGIVAHHLVVPEYIAEVMGLMSDTKAKTVVLIGPNHFRQGISRAQTTIGTWTTPYGDIQTEGSEIQELTDRLTFLSEEPVSFEVEHSIAALTPFVKRSYPNARLVPIIVDESMSEEESIELANAIQDIFGDAVVFGSIDMSHNLPQNVQEFHDEITSRSIAKGSLDFDLEIDSNATMRTLFALNELRGTQKWNEIYHGSSIGLGYANTWRDNVSYFMGNFTEGDPVQDDFISLHIVGDIMLDRGVRKQILEHGIEYPWAEMTRFLAGTHLTVGNLEGTVNEQQSTYTYNPPFRFVFDPTYVEEMAKHIDVVSLANNHSADVGASAGQEETRKWLDDIGIPYFGAWETPDPVYETMIEGEQIAIIGYHQFRPNIERMKEVIQEQSEAGKFVMVLPHWGNEYIHAPQYNQQILAQEMLDAGADIILGGHPHVVQGIEEVDERLVLYSLGNFIFDQQIPETWPAVTVGMIIDTEGIELHLLPVNTRYSQPVPLSGEEADQVLERIADSSDEHLKEQILNGIIHVTYD